jgi:hypothetical protein
MNVNSNENKDDYTRIVAPRRRRRAILSGPCKWYVSKKGNERIQK